MSGDVQPRKRKDKKRKKDELGLEEPRGTAAALGEGDVYMHSHHDHGTGGHWCAKIIFFSLLAVLITLIGLIILENRGLSELEANSVESRYSGVLEGWLEDAPDDDHHDEHTLELKHPDDDEDDHDHYGSHDLEHEEDEHDHENEDEDNDTHEDEDDTQEDDEEDEQNELEDEDDESQQDEDEEIEEDEDEGDQNEQDEDDDDHDEQDDDDEDQDEQDADEDEQDEDEQDERDEDVDQADNEDEDDDERYDTREVDDDDENEAEQSEEEDDQNEDEESQEQADDEEEDEHHEDEDEDDEVEVEKIEQEASEEEPISTELPALPEEDDDDENDNDQKKGDRDDEDASEEVPDDGDDANADDDDDADDDDGDDDFLEADDEPVERITAPAGKPFVEVEEDETSSEKPPDTLEEEEEYEKQQEELRRQQEQSSHMWLKLSVGGALLAATAALMRRAAAPSDDAEAERETREETPVDRRMTLIPPESSIPVKTKKDTERPVVEEIVRKASPVVRTLSTVKQESEEEEEDVEEPEEIEEEIEEIEEVESVVESKKEAEKAKDEEKELYSDEEEEEEPIVPKKEAPKLSAPEPEPEPEPEADDVPDDVEIIDDEQLEEELEEEEDEDDISDVDDTELLTRLEAKYGRLPEPERPGQKYKDGGNSVEDEWPGEPSDAYWRQQLDSAERELRQGAWSSVAGRVRAPQLKNSGRARYLLATALDKEAEAKRDNKLLSQAILAYLELLKMNENLSDKKLLEVTGRTLDRIQFRGSYISAEPVYRLLIRRFPNQPEFRNNLTISFLMANRADLAEQVLRETLELWPNDRVALAHLGFILKTQHNKLEEAVKAFEQALDGDKGPACEPRFYYHFGDALLLLGRYEEAHEVHKRGAKHGHFLSPAQRSLYNVPRLQGKPWWNVEDTPYAGLARALEKSWKDILKEGQAAEALYEQEKEGLRQKGEWSQMELFVRGQEVAGRCARAPATCAAVRAEPAAARCRRGQVKFSAMAPGTHVRPHVGPTNCRLRMHLGLSNTKDTYIRVDKEIRQWQEGKVLLFDDSFEHEVWHNGTGKRLVLIVDVWHPQLTPAERRTLPAI